MTLNPTPLFLDTVREAFLLHPAAVDHILDAVDRETRLRDVGARRVTFFLVIFLPAVPRRTANKYT